MVRRISIICDSRTNWSKARSVCEAIRAHQDLQLNLAVCGPMSRNWDTQLDHWIPDNVLDTYHDTEPSSPLGMVEQSAQLLEALGSYLRETKPDIVLALTDRYETLCIAQASALMNIHIAHIQGGEVTGTIDESIRHAVTKLSHIHFPATQQSANRIIKMGENPDYVFRVGCPSIDLLLRVDVSENPIAEPYILFLMHPVTTELEATYEHVSTCIEGIRQAWGGKIITIGPNHDAGYLDVWRAIADAELAVSSYVCFDDFVRLMASCVVMVSNSSAGIRESAYFGVPVVNVGTRQNYRECGTNVDPAQPYAVHLGIEYQLWHGPYQPEYIYGNGQAGETIAAILATIKLPPIQKRIAY